MSEITLAILAGGQSSRMGFPKSRLRIAGLPILAHLLKQMDWPGPSLLVTAPGQTDPPGAELFDREVVDPPAGGGGGGAMRGLLTALESAATDALLVATMDMPGIARPQLDFLIRQLEADSGFDAIMLQRGGQGAIEPFPSIYRRSMVPLVRAQIETQNRAMRSLARSDRVRLMPAPQDWPAATWTNLNTPADLDAFALKVER